MNDINIRGLSDHDLLIMIVDKINSISNSKDRSDRILYGGGFWFGLITQVRILWLLACGGWAVCLILLAKKL